MGNKKVKLKNIGSNILISLVTLGLCVLIADFVIRKINNAFFKSHYEIRNRDYSNLNEERIHELENSFLIDIEKSVIEDKTKMVLFVGDSVTLGIPLRKASHTYPDMFDRDIRAADADTERCIARNISGPGANIMDAANVIDSSFEKYSFNAQWIVFGYCLNDIFISVDQERGLIGIVRQLQEGLKLRNFDDPHYFYYENETNQDMVKNAFSLMKKIASSNRTKITAAIFPYFIDFGDREYRYEEIHKKVKLFARESGVDVFDLYPVFSQYHYSSFMTENDHSHPNPLGHKFAADALYKYLSTQREDLLPPVKNSPNAEVVNNPGSAEIFCETIYEGESRYGIDSCYKVIADLIKKGRILKNRTTSDDNYFFIDFGMDVLQQSH